MFVKVTNGKAIEYTIGQLRRDYPNTSFPRTVPNDMLGSYDIFPYMPAKPHYYDVSQHLIETGFSQDSFGSWVKTYVVENTVLPIAEQAARTKRNELLAETDWIVAKSYESGNPVPTDWANYRQSLRDVTGQTGFPYDVNWPTKPE